MFVKKKSEIYTKVQEIEISELGVGQRLDNYLLRLWKKVPKSHVYRLIRKGQVRVNGSRSKVHTKLNTGDHLRLPPLRLEPKVEPDLPDYLKILLDCIVYEDESLLMLDKPSGVAVHGGSGIRGGVIEALRLYRKSSDYLELVHRLDRETSGCLLLAKTPYALRLFHDALRDPCSQKIRKKYLSLLVGKWKNGPKDIDLSLETIKSNGHRRRSIVTTTGRAASSRFTPIRYCEDYVLAEIELRTGRMHQIRAHAAAIGHPVAGDQKYGSKIANRELREFGLKRLFLHAVTLEFIHPNTGQWLKLEAPIPESLMAVVEKIP